MCYSDVLFFFILLFLFLLFLCAVLALAFRRAEQAVLLLRNKHLPAILAHVERVVRIREHEAEYSVADYLIGQYTFEVPAHHGRNAHHAGPGVALDEQRPVSLGEMVSRPSKGAPYVERKPEMVQKQGSDKRAWLAWDGQKAVISSLDDYVLHHRRRMKPCTAFDTLNMDSGENHLFGSPATDYAHFNPAIGEAIEALRKDFPEEAEKYAKPFEVTGDTALTERIYLINPMNFIGTDEQSTQAKHYRIRVGASDADTAFTVSMALAVKLANAGYPVDYALVWDQPHSEADYPGEVLQWIDAICME